MISKTIGCRGTLFSDKPIRLVMQDFATIHSIIGIHRMYNHIFAQQPRDLGVNEDRMTVYVEIHENIMGIYPTNMTHI